MSVLYSETYTDKAAKKHLAFVDLAKCFALCCIIVAHSQWFEWVSFLDDMRLVTFYICAGYTSRTDVNLIRKSSLLLNYALMTVLCALFAVFYSGMSFTLQDFWGALYARYSILNPAIFPDTIRFLPLYNSVLWFLPSLFVSYCLFKVIMRATGFYKQLFLCFLSLVIGTILCYQPYLLPWSADTAFVTAVFMCVGHWLRRYKVIERCNLAAALACFMVYAILSSVTGYINLSIRNYGNLWPMLLPTAVSGVMTLLILCKYFERTWLARLAVVFNSQALFIFGLQLVFMLLTDHWLAEWLPDWKLRVAAYIVVCFAGGYIIGVCYDALRRTLKELCIKILTKNGSGS